MQSPLLTFSPDEVFILIHFCAVQCGLFLIFACSRCAIAIVLLYSGCTYCSRCLGKKMAQCLKNGTMYRKAGIGTLNTLFGSIYPEVGQENHVNTLCKYSCSIWQKILLSHLDTLANWETVKAKKLWEFQKYIEKNMLIFDAAIWKRSERIKRF